MKSFRATTIDQALPGLVFDNDPLRHLNFAVT